MKKSFFSIICLMAALTANQALASGDAVAGESKVAVCAGCHGGDGNSMVASFPKLAGLGENYLVRQLRDIKSGERVIASMTGILDASSDQDLQDMAAYYNSQTATDLRCSRDYPDWLQRSRRSSTAWREYLPRWQH